MKTILSVCIVAALLPTCLLADVRLPAIISNNMVIQADANVHIWGWADPNETVSVNIAGQHSDTKADAQGKWSIHLRPLKAAEALDMTVKGKNTVIITNVLVGQVWVGSGQSNMTMSVTSSKDPNTEIRNARHPQIRLFAIQKAISAKPMDDCSGQWVECSPATIGGFSATLYFFGRDIYNSIRQPVGLIESGWGGTPIQSWTSEEALGSDAAAKPIMQNLKNMPPLRPNELEIFKHILQKWELDVNNARASGKPAPPRPSAPYNRPTLLYNAMISPITPYTIKGVLWYQGEANVGSAWLYSRLLPLMIQDWRKRWDQETLPFYFVQLPNYGKAKPQNLWPELRQAQLQTLKTVPNTGMAVAIDIGEANNIHPRNKQEIGRRLALIALARDYSQNIEYSGPIYKDMRVDGNSVVIHFDHADSGFRIPNGELKEFVIADENKRFYPAQVRIIKPAITSNQGGVGKMWSIVVWSKDVPHPVAVRYAWSDNPEGANLYNFAGIPASPFKTDQWPWITENTK
jgi:sialate O-acetylesterase